jgi:hypothetical protein
MPTSFWDDLFPVDNEPSSGGSSSSVFDDDLWSDDPIDPQRGLAMDDWTPEYQKTEGWNGLIDNPLTKFAEQSVLSAGAGIFKAGSAAADLFDSATNSELAYTGPLGAFIDLPQDKQEELDTFIDKNKQTSMSAAVSDIFGDVSNMMSDASANLSTKKDSGGGYMAEMGGNIDNMLQSENVGDVLGSLWETAEDTMGMAKDVGAGMLGSAIAGKPLASVTGLGSVGTGMALQSYGDTYEELTKNKDDSRLMAVGVSAANAAVQGVLEKIGWETALGKGPVADWFQVKAKDSITKAIMARAMLTAPTEGSEEFLQGLSDILAKNLPNLERDGWDATSKKITIDAYEQLPEQFVTGFAFGGLLGGGVAPVQHLAAKDVAARFGNLPSTADEKLAGAINKPPSEDAAKAALVD